MEASGGAAAAAGGVTAEELAARAEREMGIQAQSQEDVEVVVPLPKGVRAKQCKVVFGVRKLKVVVPAAAGQTLGPRSSCPSTSFRKDITGR